MSDRSTDATALERSVRWLGLSVATVDGVLAPFARLSHLLSDDALASLAWVSAGTLAILFLRTLSDRECRQAIDAANAEMRGEGPFKWRWIPLLDPTWGVLGSRFGGGYLTMLRLAMLLEFVVGLIVQDWGRPQPALIAAAGFAITVMLSIAQLKEHYPPKTGRGGRQSPL